MSAALDVALAGNVWLDTCLAPLVPLLARPDVTDLHVNRPGEVWVETLGQPAFRADAPELTAALLLRLARQLAAVTAQGISRQHPLLAASLPSGERVQIAMPPATRGHLALSLRKHVSANLGLEDYCTSDGPAQIPLAAPEASRRGEWSNGAGLGSAAVLRRAVTGRRNILVAGGTSTGKTTFLNTLIREIPRDERRILIEDTPELQLEHPNAIGLLAVRGKLGEADVTPEDVLIASLRMRPDRIILGEVRGAEAMTFLRAINTGHPGSLSTIHADSPEGAIDQLVMLALQAGSRMRWEDIDRYVRRTIDVIVQLERRDGRRQISQIVLPK